MEEQTQPQSSSLFGLTIDLNSKAHLLEAAKWTKFLAIAGFIFIGLMVSWGILMPELMKNSIPKLNPDFENDFSISMFRTMMIVYMLVFAAIYFFPCLYTLRFSNLMKRSLHTNNQEKLTSAFKNLKITVRYLGVLTIIFLSLSVLVFVIFLITFPNMPGTTQ
jgi:uncharacterized membrane protein YjgN (DUF898 family)